METKLHAMNKIPFPLSLRIEENMSLFSFSQDEIWEIIKKVVNSIDTKEVLYENFAMSINNKLIDHGKQIFNKANKDSLQSFLASVNTLCGDNFIIYFSGWNKIFKNDAILRFESALKEIYNLNQKTLETLDFEFFIGKYPATFGGVHREFCSNLQYVFYGEKSFHLWPTPYFENHEMKIKNSKETNHQLEDYLLKPPTDKEISDGVKLTANQNGAIYIPYHWWHVGASPHLSASMTIAFYD
jgi:hypothetical protein